MYRILAFIIATLMALGSSAQATKNTKKRLGSYFDSYQNTAYNCKDKTKVEKLYFRSQQKEVEIVVSEIFLGQPFTNELVKTIYNDILRLQTDFQEPIEYAHENGYDGLIILTDGYAPAPRIPDGFKTRILWVCENEDCLEQHKSWMEESGRTCVMQIG